ncbi:uncharacterized protein METZ01_LOCUS190363 [marine metagenome]|uniref:Uncharacterized protein n=1 Tax=marine metagenome TaxID=408172 RepID=A0A382DH88_9ZZZZ
MVTVCSLNSYQAQTMATLGLAANI